MHFPIRHHVVQRDKIYGFTLFQLVHVLVSPCEICGGHSANRTIFLRALWLYAATVILQIFRTVLYSSTTDVI
jgi:hypothetical protein